MCKWPIPVVKVDVYEVILNDRELTVLGMRSHYGCTTV